MDADYQDRRREHTTSRREKRWSMYSQRLEEIVAELMKPISDIRRSFDTDLSALLEEYLTEAGLHALNASEEGDAHDAPAAPNFAELALLLQHSASLYGRKVDFLYQHVISVNDSLHNNTQERAAGGEDAEAATPSGARRRRRHSGTAAAEFLELELEGAEAARRDPEPPRPPPTLPRIYIELEPRVLADCDLQLLDYAGEPIGLPSDFYVTRRLQGGLLVDELEGRGAGAGAGAGEGAGAGAALRPVSLVELQAAIEARTPAYLPTIESLGDEPASPARASTPLSVEPSLPEETLLIEPKTSVLTPVVKRNRKRRSDTDMNDIPNGSFTMSIDAKVRRKLLKTKEFSISSEWIEGVVSQRKSFILAQRKKLRAHVTLPPGLDFRGFDFSEIDIGGFFGWSGPEGEAARGAAAAAAVAVAGAGASASAGAGAGASATRLEPDSEDDGFFEQSSLGDSDDTNLNQSVNMTSMSSPEPCASWRGYGGDGGDGGGGGGVDVAAMARSVLAACGPCAAASPTPFSRVVRAAAADESDVSRLLLATLFLANAGNVEIAPGPALSINTFAVRVRSHSDVTAAVAAVAAIASPPPPPPPPRMRSRPGRDVTSLRCMIQPVMCGHRIMSL